MAKISVLGAGSWGTALSVLLSNNGHEVRLWSRFQEEVDALKETERTYFQTAGGTYPGGYRSYRRHEKLCGNRRSDRSGCAVPVCQKHIEINGT